MTDTAEPATIKVTVLDEPFRIASEADPEYTREVAAHVDRTLRALRKSVPTLEPFPTAVLGAMEITDHLLRSRAAGTELAADLAARVERMTEIIDAVLESEPEWRGGDGWESGKRSRKETGGR
ncbi:MAG: cell division protein ZapA [Gemmatimonadetes bacterium]|nr:cell division protein ZapA [Gemmatimonadota bacterium]